MTELKLGVGEAHELEITLRKAGWKNEDIARLTKDEVLSASFAAVLHDTAEIKSIEHLIDCGATPFIPAGWSIHAEDQLPKAIRGLVKWNRDEVKLYLSKKQKKGVIGGHDLRQELESQAVYTANVLDYLLANPSLIPEEWKGKAIFFWGTIYRGSGGGLCVRCLCWDGGRWDRDYDWLDDGWNSDGPAAFRAS